MNLMKLAFLGTGEFGEPALRGLVDAGHEVVAVISQPDRPSGRGRTVKPTPIHAAADALNLPHVQTADVNTEDFAATLRDAELGFVVAFGQKIGPELLKFLPRGCVNLHASLLPKFRGAAPVNWAILAGERETGVTIFQLDEKWDAGPVWARAATPIGPTETASELHDRLALLGAELTTQTVAGLAAGTLSPQVQDASQSTRAPKLSKEQGRIDFERPAEELVRTINGLWSWPTAFCQFVSRRGKVERVQLARAALVEDAAPPKNGQRPGDVLTDQTVQAGRGRLRLLEVQPAGGRVMSFDDFARGRDVASPDRFEASPGNS